MAPVGSLLCSQEPSTVPDPDSVKSSAQLGNLFLKIYFTLILFHRHGSPKWYHLFHLTSNILYAFHVPDKLHIPCPYYSNYFGHPNDI